jgi:hypothetical protein
MLADLIVIGAKVSSEPRSWSQGPGAKVLGAKPRLSFCHPVAECEDALPYAAIGAPAPLLGFLIPEKRGLTSD